MRSSASTKAIEALSIDEHGPEEGDEPRRHFHPAQLPPKRPGVSEIIGLSDAVVDRYFTGTANRIGGIPGIGQIRPKFTWLAREH